MEYKISIIIPIFNVEAYIKTALESVVRQSIGFENLEVIMVNDCSTDGSGEIMDEYASKYKNFTAIHLPENSGAAGKPRNIGMQNATGEYLMFLDPDDYYTDNACEVLYNKIKEEDADIVFGKYIIFYDDVENETNKVIYSFLEDVEEIKVSKVDDDPRLLTLAPSVWTKIYKSDFVHNNNLLFPEGILMAEDLAFITNCLLNANRITFLNDYYCYYYRIRNVEGRESITNNNDKKSLMDAAEGYYETYIILKNNGGEKYFHSIFKPHLEFWTDGFIRSKAKPSEKKEVLEKIGFLFEKLKKCNVNPEKKYLIPIFDSIADKKYEEAILLAEIVDDYKKRYQEMHKQLQKLQGLQKLQKQQQKQLKEQLKFKKKQVADLQTIKGYFKYKTKNIRMRIMDKTKI